MNKDMSLNRLGFELRNQDYAVAMPHTGRRAGERAAMLRLLSKRERELAEREVAILKLERWMRQINRRR